MFAEIKNLIKHSSIYGMANILQKGIGFFMIPVYTHYLSPTDYGILELMDLTINIITMLIGMRLGTAIIRYYHHYEKPGDKLQVFSTALIFVFILTLLVVGLLECFAKPIAGFVLGNLDYYRYFQIMFIAMGLQTIASVPENLLLAQKRSVIYSAVTIGTLVSYLTFNILFLVVFEMGVMGIFLSILITKILNTSSLLIITFRRIKLIFSFEKLKKMIEFGLPLVPAAFFLFIMHFSDRFFVQKYCDLDELGLYSLGYKFGMILSVIISEPFFRIWNTQRFEIAKTTDAAKVFGRIFTYYCGVIIFAALGISVFSDEVISIMAPSEYQGAAPVVSLIVLSYVLYGMANFVQLGIMVTNKTKYAAYIHLATAGINILLNIILISNFGIIGAAISTALTFLCLAIVTFIVSQKIYPVQLEYRRVFVLCAFSLIIFTLSMFVNMPLFISMCFKGLLILIFPAALFFGRFFTEEEIQKLRQILNEIMLRLWIRIRCQANSKQG